MAAYPNNPPPAYQQAAPQYPQGVAVKQQPPPTAYMAQPVAQAYPVPPQQVQQQQQGYHPAAYGQPQTVIVTQQQTQPVYGYGYGYYSYIPCLHMGGAVVVLLFNIIGLGLGTILGGFFLLCCGHPYSTKQSSGEVFAWCLLIGFCQIALSFFSAIGWFWAIYWGILFITVSNNHYGRPFNPAGVTSTTTVITA